MEPLSHAKSNESDDDADYELVDQYDETMLNRRDYYTHVVEQVMNYSLEAGGVCEDQERWWEGKMAAYQKRLEPVANHGRNSRVRSRASPLFRFDLIDRVLEDYWQDGVLPDYVTERWLNKAI